MHNLDSGLETCAVFFDFRKAFDSVPHCKLISKLQSFQLNPALVRWICNYLSGRFQRVVVDGAISQATPVISGVPQGSVLGPLLFLLYIDSLSYLQLSHGTKMVLYADDVLIYRCIHYLHDYNILQNDVNQIFSWSLTNCLEFNPTKCKQMVFSRKQISIPYLPLQLGDNILERVYTYKYLGVQFTSNLSWSDHIHAKCSKAKKLLGLLYRKFQGCTDPVTLFNLYITLVRPHLEYACEIWNPHLKRDINKVEQLQKFGLRMCTRRWSSDYLDLLLLFSIPTLGDRRLYLNLCTMYKIVHNLVDFPQDVFVPKSLTRLRSSSLTSTFVQPFARTNSLKFSFIPHTCSIWNTLPNYITGAESLMAFKRLLQNYICHFNFISLHSH